MHSLQFICCVKFLEGGKYINLPLEKTWHRKRNMDTKPPHHTIEYYKSEIVKKDEIIEKLFEEVDELKENKQEHNKVVEKLKNETESLTQDNHKKDQFIESLKTYYNKALDKINNYENLLQDMQQRENDWKKRENEWIKQHDKLDELRSHLAKSLEKSL